MQGAAAARRRGLALEPTDENSWIARGHAKLGSDPQAALADFQSALAENPLSTNALQNIAHVLSERLQSPEAAIKSLSDLLSIRPSDRMARAGRGVLHGRTGNLDAAIADARYLAEAEQLKPLVQYQVGCIYALCCQQRPKLESPALAALAESFALDRQFVEIARTDPDLAAIRGNTAFINLIEAATELNKVRDADD
jgi:tetratricopeptide (TPR) repeat protein